MGDLQKEKYAIMQELLTTLGEIQSTRGTAPIEISIGWVSKSNTVIDNEVVIKAAPPIVTEALVKAGYSLDIMPEGVRVYKI